MTYPNLDKRGRAGLTTVELLIVMAIIGVLLSVAIPIMVRTGLFGGQKAELGGRELYTMLRAARVYATTYNVETALVYGADTTTDSVSGQTVPFADSYAIVRHVRRRDLEQPDFFQLSAAMSAAGYDIGDPNHPVYIPIGETEGSFKRFENETCILPDVFEVNDTLVNGTRFSLRGLDDIVVWDPVANFFFTPRVEYGLATPGGSFDFPNSFPAHVFQPDGSLKVHNLFRRQRIEVRVGLRPDADPLDRWTVDDPQGLIDAGAASEKLVPVAIERDTVTFVPKYLNTPDPNDPDADELAVDLDIELYVAQGRVKVES